MAGAAAAKISGSMQAQVQQRQKVLVVDDDLRLRSVLRAGHPVG